MKNRLFSFLIGITIVVCSLLMTGCYELCTSAVITKNLKNDFASPEFVLLGDYYTLPCSVQCFTESGMKIQYVDIDQSDMNQNPIELLQELDLPPKKYVTVFFSYSEGQNDTITINACLANCTSSSQKAIECSVIAFCAEKRDSASSKVRNWFVIQKGVGLTTSIGTIKDLYTNQPNVTIEEQQELLAKNYIISICDTEKVFCEIRCIPQFRNARNVIYLYSCDLKDFTSIGRTFL